MVLVIPPSLQLLLSRVSNLRKSYLGQVFANMFPNRVGRVVLDSVVDAAANLAGRELNIADADEAFSTFFVYCNLAGRSQCPYYTGTTAKDILARFEATITKLNPRLAQLKGWANATVTELTCTLRSGSLLSKRLSFDKWVHQ